MKFPASVNSAIAIALGVFLIVASRNFQDVRGIEYGPGLFPTLIGIALILAGLALVVGRLFVSSESQALLPDRSLDKAPHNSSTRHSVFALLLHIAAVVFYILAADELGFLITMSVLLFGLLWWFDRRVLRALAIAIIASFALHAFFYQLMSVPLPWGVLEPIAGQLTW